MTNTAMLAFSALLVFACLGAATAALTAFAHLGHAAAAAEARAAQDVAGEAVAAVEETAA